MLTFPSAYSTALASSFKENWIFRLYDKDGAYIGLSFSDVTMDDSKAYTGAIINAPTVRESINFANGTSSTGNLGIEVADYTISSNKFSKTLYTGNYINQTVKVYSTLNSNTAMANAVQIFTGRLISVSLTETENIKMNIVVKRPWDSIDIPNVTGDSGVYTPIAYGYYGTTLKNSDAVDRFGCPLIEGQGGDSTSGQLLYAVAKNESNHMDMAFYDNTIKAFVGTSSFQNATKTVQGQNGKGVRDYLERKYYIRPTSFLLEGNNSWSNTDNIFDSDNLGSTTGSATFSESQTLTVDDNTDNSKTSDIKLFCPNVSGKIVSAKLYTKASIVLTDDVPFSQEKIRLKFNGTNVTNIIAQSTNSGYTLPKTHVTSSSSNDPIYAGTAYNEFDLKAWADSNNSGRFPESITVSFELEATEPQGGSGGDTIIGTAKLYDMYIYAIIKNDFSDEPTASKIEADAQKVLWSGVPTSNNTTWTNTAGSTVQATSPMRIHRELLHTHLGVTDAPLLNGGAFDGGANFRYARCHTEPNKPKPIKKFLDTLAYEGGFVFRFDAQNRPVYHFIEDSPSADITLTHSDVLKLKIAHTSLKELITQWNVQYEKNPAQNEYKQKTSHTSSVRTNFFPANSKENIKDVKLDMIVTDVAHTNGNRNASFLDYYNDILGSVKQLVDFSIVNPTKSNIEVGDVITFSSMKINPLSGDWSSLKFIVTNTNRRVGGQISVQAREI